MSSRSLRRSVVVLAFAALLAPLASLQAAQTRPAPSTAPHHHNVVIQFLLGLLAGAGIQVDIGPGIDGNG
jgi:hypothetical protein